MLRGAQNNERTSSTVGFNPDPREGMKSFWRECPQKDNFVREVVRMSGFSPLGSGRKAEWLLPPKNKANC